MLTRRRLLRGCGLRLLAIGGGLAGWGAATPAWAGQLEEPLADSVRTVLRQAIRWSAPPQPVLHGPVQRAQYQRWLQRASRQLGLQALPGDPTEFLQTVWYESARAGLDRALVMGVIQVESAFRQFALSPVGARGFMQVMPFWVRLIGDGDPSQLFRMQTNLRFGCVILRHYLNRERGDLFMALGRYNGSRGQSVYPRAVLRARDRWRLDAEE